MSIGVVMNAAIEVDIPDTTTPAPVEVGTASLPALLGGGCGGLVGARGSVIVQEWELPRGLTLGATCYMRRRFARPGPKPPRGEGSNQHTQHTRASVGVGFLSCSSQKTPMRWRSRLKSKSYIGPSSLPSWRAERALEEEIAEGMGIGLGSA